MTVSISDFEILEFSTVPRLGWSFATDQLPHEGQGVVLKDLKAHADRQVLQVTAEVEGQSETIEFVLDNPLFLEALQAEKEVVLLGLDAEGEPIIDAVLAWT